MYLNLITQNFKWIEIYPVDSAIQPLHNRSLSVTIKRLTRYKQKVVLAAMLEGKSMPSNMAANTNHTTLLKNQSTIKYLCGKSTVDLFPVRYILCPLSIFGISKIPTHCLKEALVTCNIHNFSVVSGCPHKTVLHFQNFFAVLPSTSYKMLKREKNSGYTYTILG